MGIGKEGNFHNGHGNTMFRRGLKERSKVDFSCIISNQQQKVKDLIPLRCTATFFERCYSFVARKAFCFVCAYRLYPRSRLYEKEIPQPYMGNNSTRG